jgi:hypothetical protein
VYEKWPDELPSDGTLNHFLVLERGFNPQNAVKVIRILKENEGFTRRSAGGTMSLDMSTETDSTVQRQPTGNYSGRAKVVDALVERQMGRMPMLPPGAATSVGSLTWGNTTLTIVAAGPVTQEALSKLVKYVELVKDGFPKAAETSTTATQDEGATANDVPALMKIR